MRKMVVASLLLPCVFLSAFALVPPPDSGHGSPADPGPDFASATPVPSDGAIVGTIDFSPSVLNLDSGGKYVTLRLALPEGVLVSSVYVPSVRFMGTVYAETCFSDHDTGSDKDNAPHLVLKFLRADVATVLTEGPNQSIFVTGLLVDGTPFSAYGSVTVVA